METIKIYTEDLQIAQALIRHDEAVVRSYFFQQCFPLFKSIYNNYHTDCTCVREFINEMYLVVLTPSKSSGRCQMENYRGESSLASWLKSACLFYCYRRFKHKSRLPLVEPARQKNDEDEGYADRLLDKSYSTTIDTRSIDHSDLEAILGGMPNERYRKLVRLRYVEGLTNEETAAELGLTMAIYYNKHKLAKEQFISILRKEEHHE